MWGQPCCTKGSQPQPQVVIVPTPLMDRVPESLWQPPGVPNEAAAILDRCQAVRHGGMPIPDDTRSVLDTPSLVAIEGAAHADASDNPAPRSGAGSNPYFIHLNMVRERVKRSGGLLSLPASSTAGPDEELTVTELARREWNDMSEGQRDAFNAIYKARVKRRRLGGMDELALPAAVKFSPGLCSSMPTAPLDVDHFEKVR